MYKRSVSQDRPRTNIRKPHRKLKKEAFCAAGVGDNASATTKHHQCIFKCAGAVTPGRVQCSLGHKMGMVG
eukprot:COSAG02_NODE_65709_length_257_cov_0.784810_1_plen_70_part_10